MSGSTLGLVELLLVVGVVLGWAVREWWSVRPGTRGNSASRPEDPQAAHDASAAEKDPG
jgi:hypothetical protein